MQFSFNPSKGIYILKIFVFGKENSTFLWIVGSLYYKTALNSDFGNYGLRYIHIEGVLNDAWVQYSGNSQQANSGEPTI